MQSKGGNVAADWGRGDRENLLEALRQLHPGLELVDADLDLGEGRRADLVALVPAGRLFLVLLVEGGGDAPILCALEAVAFCQRNRGLFGAHLDNPRVDPELPAQVLLVAERFEQRLLERMPGISPERVRCLEVRRVASRRGERLYLVPAALPETAAAAPDPSGTRALLRALTPEGVTLAEDLLRRLERIDPELARRGDGGGVALDFEGEPLSSLRAANGVLQGRVGPHGTWLPLPTSSDANQFLEEVLRHFRHLLAPEDLGSRTGRGDALDGEGNGEAEPILRALDPSTPILTPDEIAAFQHP